MKVLEGLRYTREHEWVAVAGSVATVGITDFAQGELGDVVYVELPAPGAAATAMKPMGTIEAVKTVADIFAPVSGKVVEVNKALDQRPDLVNTSPYEQGWMVRIELAHPGEVDGLLSAEQYRQWVEGGGKA